MCFASIYEIKPLYKLHIMKLKNNALNYDNCDDLELKINRMHDYSKIKTFLVQCTRRSICIMLEKNTCFQIRKMIFLLIEFMLFLFI
jgi:hypothetical protein